MFNKTYLKIRKLFYSNISHEKDLHFSKMIQMDILRFTMKVFMYESAKTDLKKMIEPGVI